MYLRYLNLLVFAIFVGLLGSISFLVHGKDQFSKLRLTNFEAKSLRRGAQSISTIVGLNPKKQGFRIRLKEVHVLSNDLTPSEIMTLIWYLHKPAYSRTNEHRTFNSELRNSKYASDGHAVSQNIENLNCQLELLQKNVLKNDITVVLLNQHEPVHDLPKHLMYMFQLKCVNAELLLGENKVSNQEKPEFGGQKHSQLYYHDQAWRDYCIQFLGQWLEKYPKAPDKEEIVHTLLKGTLESDSSVGGTSLISLFNNRDKLNALQKVGFKIMALKLAADQSAVDSTRLTAFQICAMSGFKEVLPLLRKEVDNTNKPSLRMSAVAALGIIGEPEDYGVLQQASKSYDTRVRKAAYAAMKRLGGNSQQPTLNSKH